jgi:lipopolysaccharide export LptBFGC system permease protein LptF
MTTLGGEIFDICRHVGKVKFRAMYGAFTHLYARGFFASVMMQVLAVMGLVEAIFLAERFPIVFRDVVKNDADLLDTSLIFACTSTQIFDLALAISVLMAVYWTTLRMRENRELLVLFTAGTGPYRLIALTLAIALAAQIGSLLVSSVIDPVSRYVQRVILFDAEFRALRGGISRGQFYYFPNRVAFAPAQSAAGRESSGQSRNLFVYEEVEPGTFRVITADRARLDGPDSSGNIVLKLGGFTSRKFSDIQSPASTAPPSGQGDATACADCPKQLEGVSHPVLRASDIAKQMTIEELLPFPPRGSEAAEMTIFDLLGAKADSTSARRQEEARLLGGRLARSFLCLLAPLIALVSVCLTSRATNYLALPLACMALMSLNVTSEWLIRTTAPSGPLGAVAVPAASTAVVMALLLAVIVRKQGELVRPQLARS